MASRAKDTRAQARAQAKKARDAEVKRKAAALKKRGLIYEEKDLRKTKVTAYMRKRVAELEGVLTGDLVALSPPKGRRASSYKGDEGVKTTTKRKVIVENERDTVLGFRREMRARIIPLGDGTTIEMLSLPKEYRNPERLRELIAEGKLDRLKLPREKFAFRYNGFASLKTFPNAKALEFYLESYIADDGDEPAELVVYRVFPPEEWQELVRRESGDRDETKRLLKAVAKERAKPNRKPRFATEEQKQAKETAAVLKREKERLRKRAARLNTTQEQREKNAARMREKRREK
jgi:hypothetical protein